MFTRVSRVVVPCGTDMEKFPVPVGVYVTLNFEYVEPTTHVSVELEPLLLAATASLLKLRGFSVAVPGAVTPVLYSVAAPIMGAASF